MDTGTKISMTADFLMETMQMRRWWGQYLQNTEGEKSVNHNFIPSENIL